MINKEKIEAFWNWFELVYYDFGADFDNKELIQVLDEQINELGTFSWELGPGKERPYMLAISPNGDIENLPFTEYIISLAPALNDWEFYSAIPKKEMGYVFRYHLNDETEIVVDANNWTFCLIEDDDVFFYLAIFAANIKEFEENDQYNMVELLLDNILGEKKRILSFAYIDINMSLDSEMDEEDLLTIPHLEQQLLTYER